MDAKITKKRLSELLSYDWLKIVGTIASGILVWTLLFTTTATRIKPSQQFGIYNYLGSTVTERFNSYADSSNELSYEVIETITGDVNTGGEEYAYQIMEARLVTAEADVVFAANVEGGVFEYQKETNGESLKTTYLEDFLYRYSSYVYQLDGENGYLANMAAYLDGYYHGDYKNGELDEEKIEADFRARITANKDKRYKTEESIQAGIEGEYSRIKAYRQSLVDFNAYLDAGYIELMETSLYLNYGDEIVEIKGSFSINLCPNENMEDLKRDVYYRVTDEETEQTKTTARNMNLILINNAETEKGFEFESLTFVTNLVKTHCAALNG